MAYSLSMEQERELAVRIKSGDQVALEKLVMANSGMVHKLAREYTKFCNSYEDLVQEGYVGLVEAAMTFDPSYDNKFITYAVHYIKKNFYQYYVSEAGSTKIAVDAVWLAIRMDRAIDKFYIKHGRYPSDSELLKVLKWKPGLLKKAKLAKQVKVDIDAVVDDKLGFHETLEDTNHVGADEQHEKSQFSMFIEDILNGLPDIEREVVVAYCGFDGEARSMAEIGEELGITKQAVSLRFRNGIRRLRARVNQRKKLFE